ncbi:vWA domain-containing protein [Ilumatobacter nonamiensis]|uniref:vWA domain-containing protein n=1 Tax=Ilumatobacter nonamiensis TaxID=467093 RepID=UPI00034B60A4|nr:VWA domain-containing protein [Ilumatobacter nonamiensis]
MSWAPPSADERSVAGRAVDAPAADPARIAVAFTRLLRGAGLRVPTSSTNTFAEALCATGIDDRDGVYWAGRATLARRPEDIEVYDRAFAVFFEQRSGSENVDEEDEQLSITIAVDANDDSSNDDDGLGEPNDDPTIELRFSANEVLRNKDFAQYSPDELAQAHELMSSLRLVGSPRASLRLGPASRATPTPDIRRTMQATLRAGGEPIERHFRKPTTRLRRLVILLDVSGSMEPYARALLRFVHAAVAGRQKVEAFALGTRLTRLTRELGSRDPDVALSAATDRVVDWSGGTRLGEGLRQFNDEWGVRGLARNSIVVILSDGWDRGDPDTLAEQMERLHRVTHKLVWVNPLKVTPGYAPLARGMAAALPHIDAFVEGHSVAAMEELTRVISHESPVTR